jgi:hypothetical protein
MKLTNVPENFLILKIRLGIISSLIHVFTTTVLNMYILSPLVALLYRLIGRFSHTFLDLDFNYRKSLKLVSAFEIPKIDGGWYFTLDSICGSRSRRSPNPHIPTLKGPFGGSGGRRERGIRDRTWRKWEGEKAEEEGKE